MNNFTDHIQAEFKFEFCSVIKNMVFYVIKKLRDLHFFRNCQCYVNKERENIESLFQKKKNRPRKTSQRPPWLLKKKPFFSGSLQSLLPSILFATFVPNLLSMLSSQYSLTIKNCRLIFKIYKEKKSRKTSIN